MTDDREILLAADFPHNPALFINKILGKHLWSKQIDVVNSVWKYRQTYVASGNSVGKTYVSAVIALAFEYCFSPLFGYNGDTQVIIVGSKFENLSKQIWAEIRAAYGNSKYPLGGDMRAHDFFIDANRRPKSWISIFGSKKENVEKVQGYHAENTLIIIEEASGVEDEIIEGLESCAVSENAHVLCIANPIRISGFFYNRFNDPHNDELKASCERNCIRISSLEVPNVVLGEEKYPGLATRVWVEDQKRKYGEGSAYYQARVLGQFPQNAENCLIPLEAIEEAARKGDEQVIHADEDDRIVAMDIARQGKDQSVIIGMAGDLVTNILARHTPDSTVAIDLFWTAWKDWGGKPAIDENGLGGTPYDILRRFKRMPVRGFIAQRAAKNNERFANLKAEMGWSLRERFIDGMIAIPPSEHRDRLKADLAGWLIDTDTKGRTKIVDPSRSPDFGDALLIAHWCQQSSGLGQLEIEMGGKTLSRSLNKGPAW